jgi:hypothetical protein
MIEEYYKILRSGAAARTFRALDETGLLDLVTPELSGAGQPFYDSLSALDRWRSQHGDIPATLTNAILIGALAAPLGLISPHGQPVPRPAARPDRPGKRVREPLAERVSIGMLPLARRDVDRFRHITMLLPRLAEQALSLRQQRSIVHRPSFEETLTWLEIFGADPDLIEVWKEQRAEHGASAQDQGDGPPPDGVRPDHRRRRRRRRGRGRGSTHQL